MTLYPKLNKASKLTDNGTKRLLICCYGFEDRALGWTILQKDRTIISDAIVINYKNPKGENRVTPLRELLTSIGVSYPDELDYDVLSNQDIEAAFEKKLRRYISSIDEVIVDITAMTKFLILISLSKLEKFNGNVRIVYTEASEYAPTEEQYKKSKNSMELLAKFPSRGFETILRAKCLSSIRMQGQPVTLVAFTSFNEQLVRHMLGTLSPHQLLFINSTPPRMNFKWREKATQEIHGKLIEQYPAGNELDSHKNLIRTASTLNYIATIECLDEIYMQYGLIERIIVAVTGSKMQTVGLYFAKKKHPDMHIEYPTPDSYFDKGMSSGILYYHEILLSNFKEFITSLSITSFA